MSTNSPRRLSMRSRADSSNRLSALEDELRLPLTGIFGYVQLLSDEIADNPNAAAYAESIYRSTRRLNDVIESILEKNYLDAGKTVNKPVHISLRRSLAPLIDSHRARASAGHLDFHISWPAIDRVFMDASLLCSMIRHLLDNAIKFTHTGGVRVEITHASNSLKVMVRDTGIGIRAESIPDVFKPFWQESQGTTRTHRGLGIGLHLVKEYAELMNGTVHIVSRVNKGTMVAIVIPIHDHAEARFRIHSLR